MSRLPRRTDHRRFCEVEGWREVRNARGKPIRHHATYELALEDGRILRTRISRPINRDTYGERLWNHVLTEQLQVTEEEFWACVEQGVPPGRSAGSQPLPPRALPASLVHQLIHEVGLDEQAVAAMTRDQAIARMQQHWSRPPEE